MSNEIDVSLWALLYLYIKTPRDKYMVDAEYLSDLIDWLEPIRLPVHVVRGQEVPVKPLHFITVTNVQRYLAKRLNTDVETIHYCLKYQVYPRLGDCYEF